MQADDRDHQARRPIDHAHVHHLALAALARLEDRGHDAEGEVERAAAIVADQVERRGRLVLAADRVERARQRDVVDVVAGRFGERARAAEPGHPRIDQSRIARHAVVRAEAELLGHARPVGLDQNVRLLDQPQHRLDAVGILQIDRHRGPRSGRQVVLSAAWHAETRVGRAVDLDHVGAQVGQQHRGERPGADARELNHLEAHQRAGAFGCVGHAFSPHSKGGTLRAKTGECNGQLARRTAPDGSSPS